MSKGPGRVMQAIDAALTTDWQTAWNLAADIFDTDDVTPAQIESTRRAIRRLGELERAEVAARPWQTDMEGRKTVIRRFLSARKPYTLEELTLMRDDHWEKLKTLLDLGAPPGMRIMALQDVRLTEYRLDRRLTKITTVESHEERRRWLFDRLETMYETLAEDRSQAEVDRIERYSAEIDRHTEAIQAIQGA